MIRAITNSVSINRDPDALLLASETLEREGKFLMASRALENRVQLLAKRFREFDQQTSERREELTGAVAKLQAELFSSSSPVGSLRTQHHHAHHHSSSLDSEMPLNHGTSVGSPHSMRLSSIPNSPETRGSRGSDPGSTTTLPLPPATVAARQQQQHLRTLELELEQLETEFTHSRDAVLGALDVFLSKSNQFAAYFIREEDDGYSCTEVLCRALLFLMDESTVDGGAFNAPSLDPAGGAGGDAAGNRQNLMIGLSGQRAASHIGQPALPASLQSDIRKRRFASGGSSSAAAKQQSSSSSSAALLGFREMPWEQCGSEGMRMLRHWLSTSLNNYGCMLRLQRIYSDAATVFRCAAVADQALAPVALVNLSATFLMLERRTEAAEVARFVIRVCTVALTANASSGNTAGGKSSSLNQFRYHREQLAAIHNNLSTTLLGLAQHCLATSMETVDDVHALEAYKASLQALRAPMALSSSASEIATIVGCNQDQYVCVLESLQAAMNTPPSPPPPSSSSANPGGDALGGGPQPPSTGLKQNRSFRQQQQERLLTKRTSSSVGGTTQAGAESAANPTSSSSTASQQQQQQQGGTTATGASGTTAGVALHYVPNVPKQLWKRFREDEGGIVSTCLLLFNLEEDRCDESMGTASAPSTPPPGPDSPLFSSPKGCPPFNNNSSIQSNPTTLSSVGGALGTPLSHMSAAILAGGGSAVNCSERRLRWIAQRALERFLVVVDGETVSQRLEPSDLRRGGLVVAPASSVPTGGGGTPAGGGGGGPRPPAGDAPAGSQLGRKRSTVSKSDVSKAASGRPQAQSPGGGQQPSSPMGSSSPTKAAGYALPPKLPPAMVTAEALMEENKKKDDVVSFLASRLTQLLRVEDYHSMRHMAALRIQWFVRPLVARRVMRFHREREERAQRALDIKRNTAVRRITRFFRRVMVIRQRVRDQREHLRLMAQQRRHAIIVFQKYTRRWNAIQLAHRLRRRQRRELDCAIVLQRWARMCLARRKRLALQAICAASQHDVNVTAWSTRCAAKLQATYRAHRTYIDFLISRGEHERALRLDRQKFLTTRATTVQRWVRGHLARKSIGHAVNPARIRARNQYQAREKNAAAIRLQRVYRGYRARVRSVWAPLVLAARARGKARYADRVLATRTAASIKIQALLRGFMQRRKCTTAADRGALLLQHRGGGGGAPSKKSVQNDEDEEYFIGMKKGYGE